MAKKQTPYQIVAMEDDNEETKKAELLIYGDIGESWWGESVTAIDVVRQLAELDVDEITVRINSYGGAVSDGLAIYNVLKNHKATIKVCIDGVAVSIASLIAMAGDMVNISENALFMMHAPWGGAVGNSKEMRDYADVLDTYALAMASSYVRKSGQDHQTIMDMLTDGADHWYTASEAVDSGFADLIVEEEMAAAAGFDKSKFAPSANKHKSKQPDMKIVNVSAQVRSMAEDYLNEITKPAALVAAINQEEAIMPKPATTATDDKAAQDAIAEKARTEALAAERTRKADIRSTFSRHLEHDGVREILDACIDDDTVTPDLASKRLLAKLGEGKGPLGSDPVIEHGETENEKFIEANTQALLARVGAAETDRANPYRGMRLAEMARACLTRAGANMSGQTPEEFAPIALSNTIVRGAQTTSDFPVILENVMHKLVLTGFEAQNVTWDRICKIGDVTDFREWNRIVPGLIGNLDSVNEKGEYLDKNIPDGQKNPVQATRRGNIISITPEVLINDDTGYISDMSTTLGRAGNRAIERAVYTYLESNPTLKDGTALFHADHNNLASSGAAISVASLDAAGSAMAQQTAPGGDAEYLDIEPAVALVSRGKRGLMHVTVNAQYDPDTANKLQKPNMVQGIVDDIVATPRISALPWYLFADPNTNPVLEVVFLNGQRQPRIVQEENFATGGLKWRVELPFGVGAIDFRGGYKNPGA